MASTPVLVARQLSKTVSAPEGELTLLEHIDLTVQGGDTLAITGPSGSGKST
ncbi:MAG TPA: ABC transporter, partial [Alcanivorax sp.]|nr:ABC transporter [Alcanivorax sp.]